MKSILNFIAFYVPYRIWKYNKGESDQKFNTIITLVGLLMIKLLSIFLLANTFINQATPIEWKGRMIAKYVVGPIILLVLFFWINKFYKTNKELYEERFVYYDAMQGADLLKMKVAFIFYILLLFSFFVFSLGSGRIFGAP